MQAELGQPTICVVGLGYVGLPLAEAFRILDGKGKQGTIPQLWDDKAAERIVHILAGALAWN